MSTSQHLCVIQDRVEVAGVNDVIVITNDVNNLVLCNLLSKSETCTSFVFRLHP